MTLIKSTYIHVYINIHEGLIVYKFVRERQKQRQEDEERMIVIFHSYDMYLNTIFSWDNLIFSQFS